MPFWFAGRARCDLLAIIRYYAEQSEMIAERFVDELGEALKTVCTMPGIGSARYASILPDRSLRTWGIRYFPFQLFYRNADEQIAILRIMHERREFSPTHFDGASS